MALRGAFGYSEEVRRADLQQFIVDGASRRSMSNMRLLATAGTLLFSLFMVYCSLFYLPAFASDSMILRLSTEEKVSPAIAPANANDGWLSPYLDLLRQRRGYIKLGATIEAVYVLSEPGDVTFQITRCDGPRIVEIFQCKPVETFTVEYKSRLQGVVDYRVPAGGFYQVKEVITSNSGEEIDYDVIWRRK